jgi:hypothetical protein
MKRAFRFFTFNTPVCERCFVMLGAETSCEHRILVCQCLKKESVGGLRRSWEDNSKQDLGKLGCEDVKYFDVTWDEVTSKYCTSSQPDFPRSSLLLSSPLLLRPSS